MREDIDAIVQRWQSNRNLVQIAPHWNIMVCRLRGMFGMLVCVLNASGLWFRGPQAIFLVWQSWQLVFLSSQMKMQVFLVIWGDAVVLVDFIMLVVVSGSCAYCVGSPHGGLSLWLKISLWVLLFFPVLADRMLGACCRWSKRSFMERGMLFEEDSSPSYVWLTVWWFTWSILSLVIVIACNAYLGECSR